MIDNPEFLSNPFPRSPLTPQYHKVSFMGTGTRFQTGNVIWPRKKLCRVNLPFRPQGEILSLQYATTYRFLASLEMTG
jgi:hypothetical protein